MAVNEYPFGVGRLPAAALNAMFADLDTRVSTIEDEVTPTFALRLTSAQTVTSGGTGEPIEWNTADEDSHNGWDVSPNPSRYTIPRAGSWCFGGGCGWTANATGRRGGWFTVNATAVNGSGCIGPASAANSTNCAYRTIIVPNLVVGDYVEMIAFQDRGSDLATSGTTFEQPAFFGWWRHA